MWEAIKGILASKKAMMAVLSALVWVLCKFGLNLSVEDILPIVGPLWGYVFGQAVADVGKSKAEILAAADKLRLTTEKPAADPT